MCQVIYINFFKARLTIFVSKMQYHKAQQTNFARLTQCVNTFDHMIKSGLWWVSIVAVVVQVRACGLI